MKLRAAHLLYGGLLCDVHHAMILVTHHLHCKLLQMRLWLFAPLRTCESHSKGILQMSSEATTL